MTERIMRRVDDVWRLDTGGQSDSERRQSGGGSNGTTQGDITKESEEMQIEALKGSTRS